MIVLTLLMIGLMLYNIEFKKNKEYLSIENTTSINGIFIILVFYRHLATYVKLNGKWDVSMNYINSHLFQLLVVPFLFYSGYGIMQSIKKNSNYVNGLPRKRILRITIHFMIAVASYLALGLAMHKEFPIKKILLSFIGWESLGNSNWYIFCIIFMYIFTWAAFKAFPERQKIAIIFVSVLSVLFVIIMGYHKDPYWFNTALAYPLGMWIAYYKDQIDELILEDNKAWALCFVVSLALFHVAYKSMKLGIWYYQFGVICFAIVILLFTMRVSIKNKALFWLGKGLFGLYIMQRFPMQIFKHMGYAKESKYLYVFLCAVGTLVIGYAFNVLLRYVDRLILPRKKQN